MSIKIAVVFALVVCCVQVLDAAPAPAPWAGTWKAAVDVLSRSGKTAKDWLAEKKKGALLAIGNVASNIKSSAANLREHVTTLTEDAISSMKADQILDHIRSVGDEINALVDGVRKQIRATLSRAQSEAEKQINSWNDKVSEAVALAEEAGLDVSECDAGRVYDEVLSAKVKAENCMKDEIEDAQTILNGVVDIGKETKRIVKVASKGVSDCSQMPGGWRMAGLCSAGEFGKSLVKLTGLGIDTISVGVDGTALVASALRKQFTICINGVTDSQLTVVEEITEDVLTCIDSKKFE